MYMKKIFNTIFFVATFALVISCADDSLDPYQIKRIQKGTMLALRGEMFNNIYNLGLPGAEFFPTAITGEEIFNFDAEYLSEDPNTLESFDIYIIKKTKVGNTTTRERIFFKNVPFTEFQTTDDYVRPWVSVSLDFEQILNAIDITLPLDQDEIDLLLDTYKAGINIESDLNLTDGSHVYAAQIVSGSLFGSDQFYPAQKLTYTVTKYCEEDIAGTYSYETIVAASGDGDYANCGSDPVVGVGELIRIGVGRYSITDASFGQFNCAWDGDIAEGVNLSNFCDVIAFGGKDQYDEIYTMSSAKVSPDGTQLSFKWENDYADKGETVLTRTDGKLWPLALHSE
jgi:hypothetical protein